MPVQLVDNVVFPAQIVVPIDQSCAVPVGVVGPIVVVPLAVAAVETPRVVLMQIALTALDVLFQGLSAAAVAAEHHAVAAFLQLQHLISVVVDTIAVVALAVAFAPHAVAVLDSMMLIHD